MILLFSVYIQSRMKKQLTWYEVVYLCACLISVHVYVYVWYNNRFCVGNFSRFVSLEISDIHTDYIQCEKFPLYCQRQYSICCHVSIDSIQWYGILFRHEYWRRWYEIVRCMISAKTKIYQIGYHAREIVSVCEFMSTNKLCNHVEVSSIQFNIDIHYTIYLETHIYFI